MDPSFAPSPQPDARSRKNFALILQAISRTGLRRIAEDLGKDESTVSRMKESQLPAFAQLLASVGLKVVPAGYHCLESDAYRFMKRCTVERLTDDERPNDELD